MAFVPADSAKPFDIVNQAGRGNALLICDHASNAVPSVLADLGLSRDILQRHIAWDIGAAEVTRRLAQLLDGPALLAGFSRLVIDPNRPEGHDHSIRAESDGIFVPGNAAIDAAAAERRAEAWFRPYHAAVAEQIARLGAGGVPAIIAVHSFTPVMAGHVRPWHAGVLHAEDTRLARAVLEAFAAFPDLVVGDNQPYTGFSHESYTLPHHAERSGLPNVALEVRQDLIDTPTGAEHWARLLAEVLRAPLADGSLRRRLSRVS